MRLPAILFITGILLITINVLADDAPQQTASATPNAEPKSRLDRRPGIMENWEANANIFSLDDLSDDAGDSAQ